ncbi:MAG TPA: hypothetical protein VFF30_13095 [Nitrososphaerales archaeon]|nr:hypothetical protein [Nitrososphaerales archaeon]
MKSDTQDDFKVTGRQNQLKILIIWISAFATLLLGGYIVYGIALSCCPSAGSATRSAGEAYASAMGFGIGIILLGLVLQEKLAPQQRSEVRVGHGDS